MENNNIEVKITKKGSIKKEEKKKKDSKGLIIVSMIFGILIILFILWLLLRLKVTFKYNNGDEDFVSKVRLFMKVPKDDIKSDLEKGGYTFAGYFETYEVKENSNCKENFKLNDGKTKCVSVEPFDFENTRILCHKTIEAMWSSILFSINPNEKTINKNENFQIQVNISGTEDRVVNWSSADESIASVDENGKVTGLKVGKTTIIAEFHGMKRKCEVTVLEPDTSKISLSSSKKCIVDSDSAKITAKLTDASKYKLSWDVSGCYSLKNKSDTVKLLTRKSSCDKYTNLSAKVTAKLSNGKSASVTVNYEPKLDVKVYNRGSLVTPYNGSYYGNDIVIKTNIKAAFSGNYISNKDNNSVTLRRDSSTTITVKTSCGQTKTIKIIPIIN